MRWEGQGKTIAFNPLSKCAIIFCIAELRKEGGACRCVRLAEKLWVVLMRLSKMEFICMLPVYFI